MKYVLRFGLIKLFYHNISFASVICLRILHSYFLPFTFGLVMEVFFLSPCLFY